MRVVRLRAAHAAWKREFDCDRCESRVEVEKSDLDNGNLTFVADGRDGNAYTFTCPVCGHVNWLDASLVPS